VLDGEIAVPDERGATHIGDLQEALARGAGDRLAYVAFDALYLDLRACPIEERKALLERVLKQAACPRVLYVSHVIGNGDRLFESARREGIVSKKLGSRYKAVPRATG
jgi:bifunctional non-homologous end joining protein LigD